MRPPFSSSFLALFAALMVLLPTQSRLALPQKLALKGKGIIKGGATIPMPSEVRDLLPTGATSLYLGQLSMGSGGQPMLVHLWAAGRKSPPGGYHQFEPSPFCVDVFKRSNKNNFKSSQWSRLSTTVYLGEDGPRNDPADGGAPSVSARWLYPNRLQPQAPVLVIVSPYYISTQLTVITYPHGFENSLVSQGHVQMFFQGGVGGGKTVYDFGVDSRGTMTVLEKSWYLNSPVKTSVLSWNGREYVGPPHRKSK
jgi:hypothetical protein